MRKIIIYACGLFMVLVAFACVQKDNVNLEWKKEGQGIWKISVGKQEKVTLLSELDITPQWKAIEEIGDAPLVITLKMLKRKLWMVRPIYVFHLTKMKRYLVLV